MLLRHTQVPTGTEPEHLLVHEPRSSLIIMAVSPSHSPVSSLMGMGELTRLSLEALLQHCLSTQTLSGQLGAPGAIHYLLALISNDCSDTITCPSPGRRTAPGWYHAGTTTALASRQRVSPASTAPGTCSRHGGSSFPVLREKSLKIYAQKEIPEL